MALPTEQTQVVLVARPAPAVTADLFAVRRAPVPRPGPGELLIQVLWLSIDPAMRGWIADAPNYRPPVPLNEVMFGFTVGRVVESNHPDYVPGELVYGTQGWQEYAVSDGSDIDHKVDPAWGSPSAALGVLGHTGLTAYLGLLDVGQPKEGETVLVTTAAGAVGSVVGQIARLKGCRTVGLAGSDEKVRFCREFYGFDAAINYRSAGDRLADLVAEACPDGVDIFFDNVSGPLAEAVFPLLNTRARVVQCGTIGIASDGSANGPRPGRTVLAKRIRWEGFLVLDHFDAFPRALADLGRWVADGRIRHREDVVEGLASAPDALCGMLAGRNLGKVVVKVARDTAKA